MYKKLILSLVFTLSLFAGQDNFVSQNEAFKISSVEYKDKVSLEIILAKDIYLYDDAIKIMSGKVNITKQVKLQKPVVYHKEKVYLNSFKVDIPRTLITNEIKISYQGCSTAGICYPPSSKKFNFLVKKVENETDVIAQKMQTGSLISILGLFFGFGLLLSLTPCIFPMIPILSSIIVTHSKNEKSGNISASKGFMLSLVYVFSMSIAYTLAGILAGVFGANIQAMLQNPTVIIVFASIFIILAFSMFGYFKLELPQSWQRNVQHSGAKESKKGIFGVAIMGFLSALIVGPCVAPPLAGALVYIGQTGDAVLGGLSLFVMSFGMGLPLLIVGAGAGKFMPKPGGWMDTVSKVFGVVMLGIAIYMLQRVLSDTTIMFLWLLLTIGSLLYIIKINKLFAYITSILLVFISIQLLFNIFLGVKKTSHLDFKYIKNISELNYELKNTKKPIMLDFWASWCVSCKELEDITFSHKDVQKELKKYKLLKIDMTENSTEDQALQKRFKVFGPPALIFFDKNGNEINSKKIVGYKTPKQFLEIIK